MLTLGVNVNVNPRCPLYECKYRQYDWLRLPVVPLNHVLGVKGLSSVNTGSNQIV